MKKANESVPVRGKVMKNTKEGTKDKSVLKSKDTGISATYKKTKSTPNAMLPHKHKDGMVPVCGTKMGK